MRNAGTDLLKLSLIAGTSQVVHWPRGVARSAKAGPVVLRVQGVATIVFVLERGLGRELLHNG